MEIDPNRTVAQIVARTPRAAEVFEEFHIDYCCKGARRLADACADAGLSLDAVVERLTAAMQGPQRDFIDWTQRDAASLIAHLLETHHPFTRRALERAELLMTKVVNAHAEAHPEVLALRDAVFALRDDLLPHLMREERVLFPYILTLHERRRAGAPPPRAPFGTVRNPVQMMNREHEAAGEILGTIETLTQGYTPPTGACTTWRALYELLKELTEDLHRHIHLETEVLFPLALSLEAGAAV